MYNYIVIISLIIFLFFISADPKITKNIIKKNSVHIIFFLLLIYFVYNNLHLGFFLLIIMILILYSTSLKMFFLHYIRNPSDIKNWRDMFSQFSWESIMEGVGDILNDDSPQHINIAEDKPNLENQFLKNNPSDIKNIDNNNEVNDLLDSLVNDDVDEDGEDEDGEDEEGYEGGGGDEEGYEGLGGKDDENSENDDNYLDIEYLLDEIEQELSDENDAQ